MLVSYQHLLWPCKKEQPKKSTHERKFRNQVERLMLKTGEESFKKEELAVSRAVERPHERRTEVTTRFGLQQSRVQWRQEYLVQVAHLLAPEANTRHFHTVCIGLDWEVGATLGDETGECPGIFSCYWG